MVRLGEAVDRVACAASAVNVLPVVAAAHNDIVVSRAAAAVVNTDLVVRVRVIAMVVSASVGVVSVRLDPGACVGIANLGPAYAPVLLRSGAIVEQVASFEGEGCVVVPGEVVAAQSGATASTEDDTVVIAHDRAADETALGFWTVAAVVQGQAALRLSRRLVVPVVEHDAVFVDGPVGAANLQGGGASSVVAYGWPLRRRCHHLSGRQCRQRGGVARPRYRRLPSSRYYRLGSNGREDACRRQREK